MNARISGTDLSGTVKVPGSKSYSQRYILLAGMGSDPVSVHGVHFSEDEQVAIGIIRSMGSSVTVKGDTLHISPDFRCPEFVDVGESATSYRLTVGILAAGKCRTEFRGRPELARRPIGDLERSLTGVGVKFIRKEDGFVSIDASSAASGNLEIDQSKSSQYVSSLLLYLALSGHDSEKLKVTGTRASEGYVSITVSCLEAMGYSVKRSGDTFTVSRGSGKNVSDLWVEKDFSSASFFIVLGALASKKGISINDLTVNSLQADSAIVDLLKDSGDCLSETYREGRRNVTVSKNDIGHIEIDADITPDLAPPVSVIGIFSRNGITIRNPSRLKIKETDRKSEIMRLARSFGADIEDAGDYLKISRGDEMLNPEVLAFDDHRMVMSAIVAGMASGFSIRHENLERINKSYPSFLRDLGKVGATIEMEPVT